MLMFLLKLYIFIFFYINILILIPNFHLIKLFLNLLLNYK